MPGQKNHHEINLNPGTGGAGSLQLRNRHFQKKLDLHFLLLFFFLDGILFWMSYPFKIIEVFKSILISRLLEIEEKNKEIAKK